jgi:hypothetical protein
LEAEALAFVCPRKWGRKRRHFHVLLINAVTLVGFVGADPEQRQARNGGAKFTVLSVATQRSWKTTEDEWAFKTEWHRVVVIWNLNFSSIGVSADLICTLLSEGISPLQQRQGLVAMCTTITGSALSILDLSKRS